MAGAIYLTLPAPALKILGWEDTASIAGGVSLVLPVPAMYIGAGAGGLAEAVLVQPAWAISARGVTGVVGSLSLSVPAMQMQARNENRLVLARTVPTLAITGTLGIFGGAVIRFPQRAKSSSGLVGYVGNMSPTVRRTVGIAGNSGFVGGIETTLRGIALAACGYTGVVGGASLILPVRTSLKSGYGQTSGGIQLTVPTLMLQATGVTGASGLSQAYALHLEAQALTEYTNFGLNSMATFNGVYLGATDAGIFALAGATDAGVAIDAVARVGVSDYGTAKLKRIERAYIGYRADGDMELRVITDDHQTRRYALKALSTPGIHGNHVRIGMGVQARYWQFEIANVNGSDFELNCLEIKPSRLGRRVGGEEG